MAPFSSSYIFIYSYQYTIRRRCSAYLYSLVRVKINKLLLRIFSEMNSPNQRKLSNGGGLRRSSSSTWREASAVFFSHSREHLNMVCIFSINLNYYHLYLIFLFPCSAQQNLTKISTPLNLFLQISLDGGRLKYGREQRKKKQSLQLIPDDVDKLRIIQIIIVNPNIHSDEVN